VTREGGRGIAAAIVALALLGAALCGRLAELGGGEWEDPAPMLRAICADPRRLPAATALLCGARLDVNRLDEEDLELLPGIGPARAKEIAKSRRRDGPYTSVDDLDRVPGIGPKTVERLRPWLIDGKE
jgi:competence ComEA-like helix-hairpin-helix protein